MSAWLGAQNFPLARASPTISRLAWWCSTPPSLRYLLILITTKHPPPCLTSAADASCLCLHVCQQLLLISCQGVNRPHIGLVDHNQQRLVGKQGLDAAADNSSNSRLSVDFLECVEHMSCKSHVHIIIVMMTRDPIL